MWLIGSCRCRAVTFRVFARSPYPYMRCYCSICRKTAGGGGFAINLGADATTFDARGESHLQVYQVPAAETESGGEGHSPARRHFCSLCGSALWLYDPRWPEFIHPFASAIDTPLPRPPEIVHIMLDFKPTWVPVPDGKGHVHHRRYPDESLEAWHRRHHLYDESSPGPAPAF